MSSPGTLSLPGPQPYPVLGNLPQMHRDPLAFITEGARTYGDRMVWYAPGETVVQLTNPHEIEHVLLKCKTLVEKDPVTRSLDFILGDGLLTAEGDIWKKHRKIAAPHFTPKTLSGYGEAMVRSALEDQPQGGTFDVHEWMTRVTLHIVLRTLFGMEPGGLADEVSPQVETLMKAFDTEYHGPSRLVPEWVPLPHRKRLHASAEELDRVLRRLVRQRAAGEPGEDLLWKLLEAKTEDGEGMSETEVRDEAITLFLAGHETTALTLSYTLWLLAEHPEIQDKVVAELDGVLGDDLPSAKDMRRLPYSLAAIDESMRLYPPAWTIGRLATQDIELGGDIIPEGSHILMPQWVVHRDGRWFPGPLRFRPERWLNGETADLPRFAFFPFGGGPRVCIGSHFAKMEALLVLATLLRDYRFSAVPGWRPDLLPSVTLRTHNGVQLKVERRERARQAA